MEKWRDIKNYIGFYQISNKGNVRSLNRINHSRYKLKGKSLKPGIGTHGYFYVILSKNGFQKIYTIHRMVAFCFIPNPHKKPCVNHIDGNKLNNVIENLEWVTHLENMKKAIATGLWDEKGEKHPNAKLTNEKVEEIREIRRNTKFSYRKIGNMFNVNFRTIHYICTYKLWSHI